MGIDGYQDIATISATDNFQSSIMLNVHQKDELIEKKHQVNEDFRSRNDYQDCRR